jgi:hypothetical protein
VNRANMIHFTVDGKARVLSAGEAAAELESLHREVATLRRLLAHAVAEADGWHDDARGGPITGDAVMDEARAEAHGAR